MCFCFLALAACSKKNTANLEDENGLGRAAMAGSEQQFKTEVGDTVFYLVDQSTLTPEGQETLRRQAAWLKQYSDVAIQVEGHADERGTREYNIALSARRATTTRQFLISQGIEARPHLLHRLWQGASGGAVRCRTVLFAKSPQRHGHHLGRQDELAALCKGRMNQSGSGFRARFFLLFPRQFCGCGNIGHRIAALLRS